MRPLSFFRRRSSISTPRSVYFLSNIELTRLKIGKSTNVEQRVIALQACSPDQLLLIAEIHGYTNVERWFHRALKHAQLHSEWFLVDHAVESMVCSVQAMGQDAARILCPDAAAADVPQPKLTHVITDDITDELRGRYEHGESLESIFQRFPEIYPAWLCRALLSVTHRHIAPLQNRPKHLAQLIQRYARQSKC